MRTANDYYRALFGCKVYKLSLDGGFTCPNRDGRLGTGGCAFCSGSGSGEFAQRSCGSIEKQLELAKERVRAKCKTGKYIAYFQSFTGTYAPVEKLETLFREAMKPDWIVGLSIGTRPDCLPEEVISLLEGLNREKPVSIELGLQTANDATARAMNRCYETSAYVDAVKRQQRHARGGATRLKQSADVQEMRKDVLPVVDHADDGVAREATHRAVRVEFRADVLLCTGHVHHSFCIL